MIRPAETLKRDQSDILASYRDEKGAVAAPTTLPRPGLASTLGVYGRVSSVVVSDETYGPHLLIARQQWTGTPPTASDAPTPEIVCYPGPNHEIGDYSTGDYVRIVVAHGAMIAELLA